MMPISVCDSGIGTSPTHAARCSTDAIRRPASRLCSRSTTYGSAPPLSAPRCRRSSARRRDRQRRSVPSLATAGASARRRPAPATRRAAARRSGSSPRRSTPRAYPDGCSRGTTSGGAVLMRHAGHQAVDAAGRVAEAEDHVARPDVLQPRMAQHLSAELRRCGGQPARVGDDALGVSARQRGAAAPPLFGFRQSDGSPLAKLCASPVGAHSEARAITSASTIVLSTPVAGRPLPRRS